MSAPTPHSTAVLAEDVPPGRIVGRWVIGPVQLPLSGKWATLFCSQLFVPPGHLLLLRGQLAVEFDPPAALQCNAPSVALTVDGGLHGAWEACGPLCRGQALMQALTCLVPEGLHVIQVCAAAAGEDAHFARLQAQLMTRPLRLPALRGF